MKDLEKRFIEAKNALKHYNEIITVCCFMTLISAILSLLNVFVKNNKVIEEMQPICIGICSTLIVIIISAVVIYRKEIKEYSKVRKELKAKK